MKLKGARRAIREVARRHGISENEVVREIEFSISDAIKRAREDGHIGTLEKWEKIPCVGAMPNAYEFVAYMGTAIKKEG